jgi:S-ribosylhomocysteine lyase LuxS involved in autoinducer biosynthesis
MNRQSRRPSHQPPQQPSATGPTAYTCRWTEEESQRLFEAVKQHGSNWIPVAQLLPGRNKSQCHARWTSELDAARAATKVYMPTHKQRPLQALVPQSEAPPQMLKKDEDIPATKRPRFDSPIYTSEDIVTASQMIDTVATASHTDWVVVASTSSATVASLEELSIWKQGEKVAELTESRTGKWKLEEDAKLTEAVKKHGKNWIAVASMVPGRTNRQCYTKWVKSLEPSNRTTVRKRGILAAVEDANLPEAVENLNGVVAVAELVPVRAHNTQCRQILANPLIPSGDPTISGNRGRWTAGEDAKLTAAVEKIGKQDWAQISGLVPGRTNKQCRIRWVMQLDPSVTTANAGTWSEEENANLIEAVHRHGSNLVSGRKNWSNELKLAVAATNPKMSLPQQQLQQAEKTQISKRPRFDTPTSTAIEVVVTTPMTDTETTASHNDVGSTASATVASDAKYPSVTGPTVNTCLWTEKESETLFEAVKQHGNNWIAVASMVPGRSKSQCHARWTTELAAARAATKLYTSPPPPPQQRRPQPPQCEAPSHTLQQDEDVPAAKRPRFETYCPIADVEDVDLSTHTVATSSYDDNVAVASTTSAMMALQAQPRNWWRWWQQQ